MKEYVHKMETLSLKLDERGYRALMDVYAKKGNIEKMKQLYQHMKVNHITEQSCFVRNSFMKAYASIPTLPVAYCDRSR